MRRDITFELCAETLQACFVAKEGGADRIELCSALSEDGLTPSHGLIRAAVEHSGLPVYVLLRPRSGDFLYSDKEFALMQDDLLHARSLGARGFALGILHPDATVDIERTRKLVELASPLEVTFHRAFDLVPSLNQALEDVIASGCGRVLTSGG
ncbi:MAG TPA: copper homeostasis protein CutC, partial [Edaphobacter sp.]